MTRRAGDAEVDEGLLLLKHAVRMRLKNRIVVDILTSDGAVDPSAWMRAAGEEVGDRRAEVLGSLGRMIDELRASRFVFGRSSHQHDYRMSDVTNLRRRRRNYSRIARELESLSTDPVGMAQLVDAARRDAQDEIGTAIRGVAQGESGSPLSSDDEVLLQQRIDMIASVDLPALERAKRPQEP